MRSVLLQMHPTLPRHSRVYFARVPNNVGFIAGDGPALRVWYRDSTIQGRFYSDYRPRAPGRPAGPDLFFRFDSLRTWVEIVRGPEDVGRARASNPQWERDHRILATMLARTGDLGYAAEEFGKLAAALPEQGTYVHYEAVCRLAMGDHAGADRCIRIAADRLKVDEQELRTSAAKMIAELREGRRTLQE